MKYEIDRDLFTQQVISGMTMKQLQEFWGCGRTVIANRKKDWNLVGLTPNSKRRETEDGNLRCKSCEEVKPMSNFYSNGYHSGGKKKYKPNCKSCENLNSYLKQLDRIFVLLRGLGRKYECEVCGYDNNFSALAFHHHTGEKNFEVSRSRGVSDDLLEKELSICKVLCHNCHMEEHNPTLNKSVLFEGAR